MLVQGQLQMGDTVTPEGPLADDYAVQLVAGQTITIVTRGGPQIMPPGSQLDVYTRVMQNGMELTHDDDSAGYPNSRIIFTAPATGTYVIRVTTYGSSVRQGHYTMQTMPGANPTAT
jgi:hypothetical protein